MNDSMAAHDTLFRELMPFRIREILLVSSQYDLYILEEDGLLGESLDVEYLQLNLSAAPRITRVSTGEEALEILSRRPFDLVITMSRLGEMDVRRFGHAVKAAHPDIPLVLLGISAPEAARLKEGDPDRCFDQVFIWRGDVRLFLAIIKYIEDQKNAEHDMEQAGVRAIILIENSSRFYSSYLPLLYTELMRQNQIVMADGVNAMQRLRRMRARPKILLAETFEDGWALFEKYRAYLLGVITDARFPREGRTDPEAGIEFVRRAKETDPDMPALVQSTESDVSAQAAALGAAFINKRSPRLLEELRGFIQRSLGFGDFVFLLPDGTEVDRVHDLAAMPEALARVPEAAVRYHATRNHFSNWCMARTEFELAERLRPVKVSQFQTIQDLRGYLISAFRQLRKDARRGVVADFSRAEFGDGAGFARIGTGSMGGKGRGLGFANAILSKTDAVADMEGVRVYIPPSSVIGTDVFDRFLSMNRLAAIALSDAPDAEIASAFVHAPLPEDLVHDLRAFAERMRDPIAVRSSSLLEDSHDQPFAGIYRTLMLPNNGPDLESRVRHLCDAVKLVYASTFSRNAKAYLLNTQNRMEEEKMGVILQKLVGRRHGQWFYPDFAGVACSHNYYPVLGTAAEDGVSLVALGLGKTVVDGERSVRFSPGCPQNLPQFSSTADILENAQRQFYALDLSHGVGPSIHDLDDAALERCDLDQAERDGTLGPVASTYSPDNDAVYDGLSRQGVRLVTFAPILKSGVFPLSRILTRLLTLGSRAMSCPVEIEFAVNLQPGRGGEFAFLQIRPLMVEGFPLEIEEIRGRIEEGDILCRSDSALGQGRTRDIRDVVYVKPAAFDRGRTPVIAGEVGAINAKLVRAKRPYLLIGPGRWGTSDPWLGIPVEWHHISGVRAIIETDLADVPVTPSEGTHFFQNLTSFGIAYITARLNDGSSRVDHAWLDAQPAVEESSAVRHVRLAEPLEIWVDGRSRKGIVVKRTVS